METKVAEGIFTIPHLFSESECVEYIQKTEKDGYEKATVNKITGPEFDPKVRNNTRNISDDFSLADLLWQRVKNHIPRLVDGCQSIGLNERFRFYRYESGQKFSGHIDGVFRRENGQQSRLTLMIYLNDNFSGGETTFDEVKIKPERGLGLIFRHELFHEGSEVLEGVKYVLRTDIMFNPVGRISGG